MPVGIHAGRHAVNFGAQPPYQPCAPAAGLRNPGIRGPAAGPGREGLGIPAPSPAAQARFARSKLRSTTLPRRFAASSA